MNQSIFVSGLAVSIIYLIIKFLEMKVILKEKVPLKKVFKDALVVYVSVVIGFYLLSQFGQKIIKSAPKVFTDNPGF